MKIIIAGSRDITDPIAIERAMAYCGFVVTEVVSGRARGVDTLGEAWAKVRGIPVQPFPADWNKYKRPTGKNPAGVIRNAKMAAYADALVAIWDVEVTRGTADMIKKMRAAGKPVYVYPVEGYEPWPD